VASLTLRDALLRGRRRPRAFGAGSPTTYRGDGYEFVELRAYVPGDDVRRIDWAATARVGELQTRIVLEDVALTFAAILDDSRSMRVGAHRPLLAAANEALATWFGSATSDDRCLRIGPDVLAPNRATRGRDAAAVATMPLSVPFDLRSALHTARSALTRGSALLAIGDWFDLDETYERMLYELGTRFDCTSLIARDPWYDGLPLHGLVRVHGAEGGSVDAYVGRKERDRYRVAVRERESSLLARFARVGWRCDLLDERSGHDSLMHAFGIATAAHAV